MLASLTALHHPTTSPFAIPTSFRSPRRRLGLRIRSDLRSPLLLSSTSSAPPPKSPALLDTLKVLEWHKLCDCVASFAGTSLGREATKKLLWSLDVNYEESRRLLRETAAAVEMLKCGLGGMDFGEVDTDMVKSAIERALRGFPVNGKEAIAVASIIQSADTLQSNLEALAKEDADRSSLFMPLTEVILDLPVSRTFMNSVHKVMDEKGSVKDTASSELKRSREQLRTIETKLYHQMEKLARLETSEASTLEIITVNGRWCLKVVSDQSRKYEGLLLSSGAGSESLVEPLAAVPLNDELQYTRSLANKAEEDVLSKLTDKMLEVIDDIRSLLDSTIQLDVVIARAKYSVRYGGTCPDLSLPEDKKELLDSEVPASVNKTLKVISQRQRKWKFYARGAYHPLLFQQYHENLQMAKKDIDVATSEFRRMRLQGHGMLSNDDIEPAIAPLKLRVAKMEENHPVPVDFTISVKTRVVVVTGPNTGGKTVSLKTVGLAALMAKIGLYVIASEPVQMPWFDAIYADIGDEQSLSQSLSTFSSHLKRISAIQSNSTTQSLVLLDEVGAGTNPLEGAALGMSLLESFAESGAFLTIATTHHGELKTLKYSNHLFENACMEFDEVNLRPTYRILWGVPGRSNAINIAERLGLSHSIIDTARKLYGTASAEINEIILDMETFKLDFEHHLQEARQTMMLARQNHENLLAAKHRISDQKLALKTRKSQAVMDTASLARSILRNKLREIHESRKKQIAQTQTTSGVVTSRADDKGDSHQKKGEKEDDIATAVEVCNEHPPSKSGQVENISSAAEHHGSNAKPTTARSELPKVGEEVYVAALGKKATILKVETSKGEVMVQANIMKLRLKFGDIGFQNLQR